MSGPEQSPVTFGVLKETDDEEARVALTPDIVTRLTRQDVTCLLESGAGVRAGFRDEDYQRTGATVTDRDTVLSKSTVLGFVGRPDSPLLKRIPAGTWIIGMLGSLSDKDYAESLEASGLTGIAMERLPRQLSSAQSMDEMTSQNSVMGYKAALVAADAYGSFFPMMTLSLIHI